jgi:hypothetical protein
MDNRWISDIDRNLSHEIIVEYTKLWEMLDDIVLSDSQQDTIAWVQTADGAYSAKSAYAAHFIGRTKCESAAQICKTKAPPKCKFFLWLMLQNRIWTTAHLQIRGWTNEYFCQLCLRSLETTQHMFCECPMAREIWKQAGNWIQVPSLMPETGVSLNTWMIGLLRCNTPGVMVSN